MILKRLKEPSTWASIASAMALLSSVPIFAPYTMPIGAIAAAAGILLKEGGTGDTTK